MKRTPVRLQNVTLADGIVIRELATHEERAAAVRLQDETWGAGFTERVPVAMLLVGQKVGGISAGAFARDGQLLGFVFGLTGFHDGTLVHWSDMLAVRADSQRQHIGSALKIHQWNRCHELGVETMFWTFDPFVARNAHLNFCRLGAAVEEFVPDMYGADTRSPVHGSLGTDRFIVSWPISTEPAVMPYDAKAPPHAPVVASRLSHLPAPHAPLPDDAQVIVHIPPDYIALLEDDLEVARAWRMSARCAFLHYFPRGYRVTDFIFDGTHDAAYVLTRNPTRR
jgi:predicted GNAT superfamily acetyltransferase